MFKSLQAFLSFIWMPSIYVMLVLGWGNIGTYVLGFTETWLSPITLTTIGLASAISILHLMIVTIPSHHEGRE